MARILTMHSTHKFSYFRFKCKIDRKKIWKIEKKKKFHMLKNIAVQISDVPNWCGCLRSAAITATSPTNFSYNFRLNGDYRRIYIVKHLQSHAIAIVSIFLYFLM